ncbi:MAG: hypothetical protein AAF466_09855 [Bacteroidota bacterium]
MKKLLKPASIAFYFLMLIVFFLVGVYVAGWLEAGKNQGLAGGAIVLGWGVLFGGIAFILSFFIARYASHKNVVRCNWILLVILIATYGVTHYGYLENKKQKEEDPVENNLKPKPTTPAAEAEEPTAMLSPTLRLRIPRQPLQAKMESSMGMGYFTPSFYEERTLYFYGNLNLEKSLMEHLPVDSITFKRNKYNQFEIATAPPWLVPDILKMDYDLLYFRIKSVFQEFVEVIVNTTNDRTAFVSRSAGKIRYWADFLLGVNSVEFLPNSGEQVRARPFEAASTVGTTYEFMRPLRIQNDWMQVLLVDGEFQTKAKGWIRWKRDGQLLILYNLLS